MKRKSLIILLSQVMFILTATPVLASNLRLSKVTFKLGPPSLAADGMLYGLGSEDVKVVLDASGTAVITCENEGGSEVPGQSYPKVSTTGRVLISGFDASLAKGSSPFSMEAAPPGSLTGEDAVRYGCSNTNWVALIDFVYWEDATIRAFDVNSGAVLLRQDYICTTTRSPAAVACTPVP